jgi:hypothetical protein
VKKGGIIAKVTEVDGHLIIAPDDTLPKLNVCLLKPDTVKTKRIGWRALVPPEELYFPEGKLDTLAKNSVSYTSGKPMLQALTVALKVRPQLADSLPSQTETGFNLGIAYGQKLELNVFGTHKNAFGDYVDRYSLTLGLFAGPGATDLKAANTPGIEFERKAVMISAGGFVMLGVNRFNFGYAGGIDNAVGRSSPQWIYQGKFWHGVVVAFDLLK